MFILGHTGIATGAVHAIDRRVDLRWIPVVALLPDFIDKTLWLLLPWFSNGWSRSAAHSVTGLAFFTIIVAWRLRERAWPLVLAYASHLVLDRMWWDGHILLWPFSGFFLPPYKFDHMELWWEKFTDLWTMGGEGLGAIVFLALSVKGRLWDTERWRAFTRTGRLVPPVEGEATTT